MSHEKHDTLNWLNLADKFARDGDPKGMRACAKELWQLDAENMDGAAIMAESALYMGSYDEARILVQEILHKHKKHLRGRLVKAGLAAAKFKLDEEIPELRALIIDTESKRQALDKDDAYYDVLIYILQKARAWLADADYLAAVPQEAAAELLAYSGLCTNNEEKAAAYSKYLFMRNYREQSLIESLNEAKKYETILAVKPYAHDNVKKIPHKKLKIGYISPDFREHAVASFVEPLLKDFNGDSFMIFAYATGKKDLVTKRLQNKLVNWRDLRGRSPRSAARIIAEDELDILVDLAGHTQNSSLPIMAYRPAPLQLAGIGYMNTTGLGVIDYFLSDEICLPRGDSAVSGFSEQILRLSHSHLCYAPGIVRQMPAAGLEAPCISNGYVTFGSFNNFAKVTDGTLLLWRSILDQVKDSKLVIKGKICSIPSGQDIVKKRLKRLGVDLARIELRPYSPNYLEEYRDIDIALDTMPYNGGITTCEALYMGVPVISMRGRTHGSRFGASILINAGVEELVTGSDINYVRRAIQLGNSPELIGAYHSGLRANMKKSWLMNGKNYMKELELLYSQIWQNFCII